MFSISWPVDVVGSMPSESDRTCMPRSRSRFTVFSTSTIDRPSRSTRHTTTVSPSSAYSNSFFIPGRSIAVRLPKGGIAELSGLGQTQSAWVRLAHSRLGLVSSASHPVDDLSQEWLPLAISSGSGVFAHPRSPGATRSRRSSRLAFSPGFQPWGGTRTRATVPLAPAVSTVDLATITGCTPACRMTRRLMRPGRSRHCSLTCWGTPRHREPASRAPVQRGALAVSRCLNSCDTGVLEHLARHPAAARSLDVHLRP